MQNTAYGTYRNGQILLDAPIPSIDESRVRIVFMNEENRENSLVNEVIPEKTVAQRQHDAFERFFTAIDAIDDEPITDEDLDNFASNRVKIIRDLDL